MADKRYAGTSALSALFSQIKAAINEKVTKVSGKDVVNTDVENLLCNEQTDGSYVLTAVVSSGMPTYDWGEGVPGGGSFTDITYEDWLLLTPQEQAAKDYYISNYPSSPLTAGIIGYDNTNSGMNADDVQEAVDELKSGLMNVTNSIGNIKTLLIEANGTADIYINRVAYVFCSPSNALHYIDVVSYSNGYLASLYGDTSSNEKLTYEVLSNHNIRITNHENWQIGVMVLSS